MIHVDLETRSKCDLLKSGAWRYSQDPSTEVLCMAFAIDDGPVHLWRPGDAFPFQQLIKPEEFVMEAHNAFFEKSMWKNILVPKYGASENVTWSCSAAKCAAHSLPRALDKAGAALGLSIQKDQEGKRIMMKLCKPRKPTKNNKAIWHEDPADYQKLYEYCMDDVRAERAIGNALRDLNPMERKIWLLDQKINERGIRVDMEAVEAAITITSGFVEKLNAKLPELTNGYVNKATENAKLLQWVRLQGVSAINVAKSTVVELLAGELPEVVRKVLRIRQKLGKTSIAKYTAIIKAICHDGRLRDLLMYYGGHTGRWVGKIFQPHNLPQNKFKGDVDEYFHILKMADLDIFTLLYPDVMETISYLIRPLLIPTEGEIFYGGDYSSIEARVLPWLAGDDNALEVFKQGKDIYKDLACTIFKKSIDEITPDERQLGKQGILGLGYQMGAPRFQETCKSYGIDIDIDMAEKVKNTYRNKYHKVKQMWYDQEAAAKKAIKTNKNVRCGKILWGIDGDFLYCKLPSKRLMAYYKPKLKSIMRPWGKKLEAVHYMAVNSVTKKWEEHITYGGKIVENITQAVARDLLAHAMLECEDAGYKIVLHVHDEIITERIDGSVEEFEKLMKSKPEWANGIPIEVEGWSGKRYLK